MLYAFLNILYGKSWYTYLDFTLISNFIADLPNKCDFDDFPTLIFRKKRWFLHEQIFCTTQNSTRNLNLIVVLFKNEIFLFSDFKKIHKVGNDSPFADVHFPYHLWLGSLHVVAMATWISSSAIGVASSAIGVATTSWSSFKERGGRTGEDYGHTTRIARAYNADRKGIQCIQCPSNANPQGARPTREAPPGH